MCSPQFEQSPCNLVSCIRLVAVACILLQFFATCYADTCYKFRKRAPVKAVCGRISDAMDESPVAGEKNCNLRIEIILGVGSCSGSTYVKGFDKKRDLFDTE
jgi:hypothetical protein